MKLLYHGPLWRGSTSLQRAEAFARLPGVSVIQHDTGARVGPATNLYRRIRWRLRWPVDEFDENRRLRQVVGRERPDVVLIDNSRAIASATLKTLRQMGSTVVYYTPDDIVGPHNLSWPLRISFPVWDVFFTTKTFNMPELAERGVRNPVLVGKAYDPDLHRPLGPEEIGAEYEAFDVVFIGTFEAERCRSISRVAEAGMSVVVYTSSVESWRRAGAHPAIDLRPAVFGEDYTRCWHHGKLALCFLRKLNRDRITQRTMEIAAIGRPMLAERTDEHDQHFAHGEEYVGFANDEELVAQARGLLGDDRRRTDLGARARQRCLTSGYSTADRARQLIEAMQAVRVR